MKGIGLLDQDPHSSTNGGFRARLDRILELLVGSSFGAAILYSVFWGALQSLMIGHFIVNETRFVAVSRLAQSGPVRVKPPTAVKAEDEETGSASETGDALEIWFASAKHRGFSHPCQLDFEFSGMNITDYRFGTDRRTNPHQAKYLPVMGFEANNKLPGPFLYMHFDSTFGTSHTYQLPFDYKKDELGKYVGLPADQETFTATSQLSLTPWECLTVVFIGSGIKITDFSDFAFLKIVQPIVIAP